jgi:hypothetical protein
MTNRATTTIRNAPLNSEFGWEYATHLFGEEALAKIPTYTRGPKKGQPKGYLNWKRCSKGGWDRDHGVCLPNTTVFAWITLYPGVPSTMALTGQFLGREQQLAAADTYLGPKGRARHEAETRTNEETRRAQAEDWEQTRLARGT